MLVIETNICNDIRELIITATYNGIVLCFRDLESRDQRCTKCDQYERALAKLKKQNQEQRTHYCYIKISKNREHNTVRLLSILYIIYDTCLVVLDFVSLILPKCDYIEMHKRKRGNKLLVI
jgi:hypothetical protein